MTSPGRFFVSTTPLSPPPPRRAGWFANRPLAVKFGATAGLLGLVAVGLTGLATVRMSELADQQQTLYNESVTPLNQLAGIQRAFQGDRARYIEYPQLAADDRQALLEELAERQTELQAKLAEYEPLASSPENFSTMADDLDAWYSVALTELVPTADRGDGAATADVLVGGLQNALDVLMDQMQLELDTQTVQASEVN